MAPKQQLDKDAWQWAEKTNPTDITMHHMHTAYRINLRPCKPNSCRKNCKGNPRCLVGLGERAWLCEIDDKYWHDIGDPELERRKPGTFVGLKNLGATCYVNTFLQVWFHNPDFRHAILSWREEGEYKAIASASEADDDITISPVPPMPTTICGHLQLIFARLEFSTRRYIDPTPFIQCLQLDAGQQQDAQEFSKLFITLLEDQLLRNHDPVLSTLIQRQFSGSYHYATQCSDCKNSSKTPSSFYELDLNIQGNRDLYECIQEFLQEESLDGDNQYMCTHCEGKRNATRAIQLSTLPPVLNLQLLRFVFDRKTGHKKKLNSFIQFPETLDMSQFLNLPEESIMYELQAVLIHRGPSAYSGHYVAHIWDPKTQAWFKFNDENVEKMAGRNLKLGNEEELDGKGHGKKPKTSKGVHVSRNAYMLVYSRASPSNSALPTQQTETRIQELPNEVQRGVDYDNQQFTEWIKEMEKMMESNIKKGRERHSEVKHVYGLISTVRETSECEWIKTAWLSRWFACDRSNLVPTVDNTSLLCPHNRLDPDKVQDAKCIPQEAADMIYAKYNGGPRLKGEMLLCDDCVTSRCHDIRTKARLAEDSKLITALLKNSATAAINETAFWVGKSSLRSWRKLATARAEGKSSRGGDSSKSSDEKSKQDESHEVPSIEGRLTTEPVGSGEVENTKESFLVHFNEDLLCQHDKLSTDTTCRRLVPTDIWHRLKSYFPDAPEFLYPDTSVCEQCQAAEEAEQAEIEARLVSAAQQKRLLQDLYVDRNRPTWDTSPSQLYVISNEFIQCWRQFIREPQRCEPPLVIDNTDLLCEHSGFLFDPASITCDTSFKRLHYVRPEEWKILAEHCHTSTAITVLRKQDETGQISFTVSPDICQQCYTARKLHEYQSQFTYTNATVFIRKLTKNDIIFSLDKSDSHRPNATPSHNGNGDPDYSQLNRKRRLSDDDDDDDGDDDDDMSLNKQAKLDYGGVRRSCRHRRMRGEKEVQVNSSQTLRDLKLKVMNVFSIPPFDQHLLYLSSELQGDSNTLASLHILPGSVIYLQADEAVGDPSFLDELPRGESMEEGFKGTGLLSS